MDASSGAGPTVVVWGAGSIGTRHAQVAREAIGIEPIIVPARPERVPELVGSGVVAVRSLAEALSKTPDGARSAVVIATDTSRHIRDACQALALGCDVLIEKPVSPTLAGLDELARATNAAARHVAVACVLRFSRGLQLFKARLPAIGDAHSVRIECQSYLPEWRPGTDYRRGYAARADEGGVLRDLIHEIDYAIWVFGRPHEVFGRIGNTGSLGVESEEWADLLWEAPGAPSVSIHLDYLSRIPRRSLRAAGTNGNLEWDVVNQTVDVRLADGSRDTFDVSEPRNAMLATQMRSFLDGDVAGEACTLAEGAFAVAVCDTIRRSASSHRAEPVGFGIAG